MTGSRERQYQVDWLRVLAIFLLVFYHCLISFQSWAPRLEWVASQRTLDWLWPLGMVMNIWRIPLLFVVSGMGFFYSSRQRTTRDLLRERLVRIGIPSLGGLLVFGPLVSMFQQAHYGQPLRYTPTPGYLWFLLNILTYALALLPVAWLFRIRPESKLTVCLRACAATPFRLLIVLVPMILSTLLTRPQEFSAYAGTLHGFLLGAVCYGAGFLFASSGKAFWQSANRGWVPFLVSALALFVLRLTGLAWLLRHWLEPIECGLWVLAILGAATQRLNKPSGVLNYLSEAVFPVYIFHFPVQYGLSLWLFRLGLPAPVELPILFLAVLIVSFGLFELSRRVRCLRPLLGMRALNQAGSRQKILDRPS